MQEVKRKKSKIKREGEKLKKINSKIDAVNKVVFGNVIGKLLIPILLIAYYYNHNNLLIQLPVLVLLYYTIKANYLRFRFKKSKVKKLKREGVKVGKTILSSIISNN